IYLENQILLCPFLFSAIGKALERGVEVVAVVPANAMPEIARVRRHPTVAPVFEMLEGFARHDSFLMAGLGADRDDGTHAEIYVHSKVAVIDDEWATVGSANAMFRSFYDDTELNVTAWDRTVAGGLRALLFAEHLGLSEDASTSVRLDDDRRAFAALREGARSNRERRREGRAMKGQIFAIEPCNWAVPDES